MAQSGFLDPPHWASIPELYARRHAEKGWAESFPRGDIVPLRRTDLMPPPKLVRAPSGRAMVEYSADRQRVSAEAAEIPEAPGKPSSKGVRRHLSVRPSAAGTGVEGKKPFRPTLPGLGRAEPSGTPVARCRTDDWGQGGDHASTLR